jgi:glycosyltransferase involved in cell wall biosynthesis
MTRVLFLSGLQIFPPLSGGNLRSFALANALARQGMDVFVYSLVGRKPDYLARRPSDVESWPSGVPEYVDRRAAGFLVQWGSYALALPPLWITACLRAASRSPREVLLPWLLREKLAWCDVVVADFPFLHPIFTAPSARGKLRVLSTHNVEHRLFAPPAGWRARRLQAVVRRLEVAAARAADLVATCCAEDRRFFEANAPVRTVVVPNGVDLQRFCGIGEHRSRVRQELGVADDVKVLLATGSKWGPNREAFDYLQAFAQAQAGLLERERVHILAVGNVVGKPVRQPGFTATGPVDRVEPYFAAADAAINPMQSGAGTNVKMGEFMALRLPILSTPFGARGLDFHDGETGFLFEREALAPVLSRVRRLFDEDPGRLQRVAAAAYRRNERLIDMNACVRPLVDAIGGGA